MNGAQVLLILMALFAVVIMAAIRADIRQWSINSTRKPDETFTCTACGDGPWHNSWAEGFKRPICPNCSGAD